MPKLKKVVNAVASEVSELKKSLKKKVSKAKKAPKAKKAVKAAKVKAPKKSPKAQKPKVKVYNVSGKFKVDAEGNVVKSSKNLVVESVKKTAATGKPGFIAKVLVYSK
jgi:hypothetical protein